MQPHDFDLRRYVLASVALLALIGFISLVGVYQPSVTGAFIVQNQIFSNSANLTTDATAEFITASVQFLPDGYRPLSTEDCLSALVLRNGNEISNLTLALENENGICKNLNITFANQIYNTNETSAAYEIYFGKSLQRITLAGQTPANAAVLNETNSTTIIADLALPDVARLEWNGISEPMTGNGSSWWTTKTNLDNGEYKFRIVTDKVASENITFHVNYTALAPQQNTTTQTNTTSFVTFIAPTPANNSVLTANSFAVSVNASAQPTLELEYNNITTNYTLNLTNSAWQKNFENRTNGIYKFKAAVNSISTETRTVQINYTAPPPPSIKAAEFNFVLGNAPPSKDAAIEIRVKNTGNTQISEVTGVVDIYQAGNYLQALDLGKISNVKAGEEGQLSASWVAPEFDLYSAEAKVGWDGGTKTLTTNFTIGEPSIEIAKLSREQGQGIATLTAELTNKWVEEIKNVNVKFNIYKDGTLSGSVDGGIKDIPAKQSATFAADVQTEDVQALKIEAIATYADKSASSSLESSKTQTPEQQTEAAPAAETKSKLTGFGALTGAFAKLAEPKNKKVSAIASIIISALIISAFVFTRKPRDPKAAYIKEYNKRMKGWQDYYAHHPQPKQP